MAYLKYIQYFYLFAAGFFAYLGFTSLDNQGDRNPWMMFFFAALALFMFFFRRHFYSKYQDKNKK
ncbi:MAG: hypothetical protein Q8K02_13745 [Flavobacterium sp.]|nr:hypothetical protein [Flavobacterium sp.]